MSDVTFDKGAPAGFAAFERSSVAAHSHDRIAEGIMLAQLIGATFLQKLAIPLGGQAQIYVALLVMIGATLAGLATRRLAVNGMRMGLFLLMAGGMILTQLASGRGFSPLSLLLLLTVHAPYAFCLVNDTTRPNIELAYFQKIMAIIAVIGIAQYALQFVIGWKAAFFLDGPGLKAFVFQGFHGLNPLGAEGHVYKSNGVFFLEPAIFCQFLAIAIVIEMIYFHSLKRIALYLAAIVATFSGTGLVLLAVLTPVFLIQKRQYILFALLLIVLATATLWAPALGLEKTVERIGEFSNQNTSAYARFVSIFRIIGEYVFPHTDTLLFGMGAGSFKDVTGTVSYAVHDPSWGKIIFEYGLIGALVYFPLLAYLFYQTPRSLYLRTALALQFLFLGEYILAPTVHGVLIALLAWPALNATGKSDAEI